MAEITEAQVVEQVLDWFHRAWDPSLSLLAWRERLVGSGWAVPSWSSQWYGRDLPAWTGAVAHAAIRQAGGVAVPLGGGMGLAAPTMYDHADDEVKRRFLARTLTGELTWCQLFSEPVAGSDLAGLKTTAVRDGDDWVVNGQKVWTSLGQYADYAILLARTDGDQPKHAGITYFILDMKSPGIEVRPITQITGVQHFNETFLTDVRIPNANVVGGPNEGWKVAQTTLANERNFIGSGGSWSASDLVDLAQRRGCAHDPHVRQRLAEAISRQETLKYLGFRMRTAMSQRRMPGPEMLTLKLAFANHWRLSAETAIGILGADAMLWGDDAADENQWGQHLLSQFAIRIGGGTDEIQHNIIAERGLGLPREPMPDKDLPWRSLNRVG